jgi:hypothetical protein
MNYLSNDPLNTNQEGSSLVTEVFFTSRFHAIQCPGLAYPVLLVLCVNIGLGIPNAYTKLYDKYQLEQLLTKLMLQLLCFLILSTTLFCLKQHTTFCRPDSVSIFGWNLLSWAQLIDIIPISRPTVVFCFK